jgi:transcriptional regulator with XRE-family HTH domain
MGNRIYLARKRLGLKQSDVFLKLGIGQSSYSDIETGKRSISVDLLCELSNILNIKASYLLGESEPDMTPDEQMELDNYKNYILLKQK